MKKINILTLLLIAGLCSACADAADDGVTTESGASAAADTEAVTEERWLDDLPDDLDFGGEAFIVHVRGDDNSKMEMYVESETGDVLNDAIYKRNAEISERLNIDLQAYVGAGWESYSPELTKIRASISAGDNAWQAIAGWGIYTAPMMLENCFLDLNDVEHLDFSKPWWNQATVKGCEIAGRLYVATGDISFNTLLADSYVMFINDTLAESFDMPSVPDLVRNGAWTLDKLTEIVKDIQVDLNGDGKMDELDRYGFVPDLYNSADSFYTSSDIHQVIMENELPVFRSEEERIVNMMEKLYPLYLENGTGSFMQSDAGAQINMFINGQAVIIPRELTMAMNECREMEDAYTIVPFPKLDEAQENYLTASYNGAALWSIPADNPDPSMAGAVMEALAAESYQNVTPVLFETCLQSKYARNEDTIEMLNIIRDTSYVDAELLLFNMFGEPLYVARDLIREKNKDVSSYLAKKLKTYESAVANVIETIESME